MLEPLDYTGAGEAVTKLVHEPCDDSKPALVSARRSGRLAIGDPALVGTGAHAKKIRLLLLAYRRQRHFQPASDLHSRLVLADGLACGDAREEKPHLLETQT